MASLLPKMSLLFSWVIGLTHIRPRRSKSNEKIEPDDPVSNSIECYTCTQVGVPVFHSNSCDSTHRSQWEASAGSSLFPLNALPESSSTRPGSRRHSSGPFGRILDPRSKRVQRWNRAILVARGVSLIVDSLFFYAVSLIVEEDSAPCIYVDGGFAVVVTVVRTCVDAVHLRHLWLQFKVAYVSRESLVVGCGKLVWNPRAVASHYLRSLRGFWLDMFVILPIPQTVFWLLIPKLIREDRFKLIMSILLVIYWLQFLPKIYHSLYLMTKMRKVTGYIFGSVWWGFAINVIAFLIASHVTGGSWYVLATRRVVSCLEQQCERSGHCNLYLSCSKHPGVLSDDPVAQNLTMLRTSLCLDVQGPVRYGIYEAALPILSSNSLATRVLYPIFWGLLGLSTFGNVLEPTSDLIEVFLSISIVLCGVMLFTWLIGNIQVILQVVTARMEKMQLRRREIGWWMRRRQLPPDLRRRVQRNERQRWTTMGGQDEEDTDWIEELPEGLRRDIKRFLCLDLIRKVPLFQNLDDLILDNICDRIRCLVFSSNEKIIREGDLIQRMVFIVRGRVKRIQRIGKSSLATSLLGTGDFLGDELLPWCLRRPFVNRLPAASATFVCLESTEVFCLEVNHLRYIIDHFRYKFASEKLRRAARYYSSNWRTWATVTIQMAWWRHWQHSMVTVAAVGGRGSGGGRLRKYALVFMSIKPHDHLE